MKSIMKSIYEIFESKAIASYWTDVNVNMQDPMIGTKYFPVSKQTGLTLAWIKGWHCNQVRLIRKLH